MVVLLIHTLCSSCVGAASFTTTSIGQSTPVAGATNTITMTLVADADFEDGSTLTITGLIGSKTSDSAILGVSTSRLLGESATWNQSTGQLVLIAASGGLKSGIACVISFNLTNAAAPQLSPTVSVSAVSATNGTNSIVQVEMTKPGTALYGVANGADPLLVVCGAGKYSYPYSPSSYECAACPLNANAPIGSSNVTNCTCNAGFEFEIADKNVPQLEPSKCVGIDECTLPEYYQVIHVNIERRYKYISNMAFIFTGAHE
jgi:hypothetical protein